MGDRDKYKVPCPQTETDTTKQEAPNNLSRAASRDGNESHRRAVQAEGPFRPNAPLPGSLSQTNITKVLTLLPNPFVREKVE